MTRAVGVGGGGSNFCPRLSPWTVDPQHPETIFVSCDMGGLYRSLDGGVSWTQLDGRLVQGWEEFSVAFDPANVGHVAAWHPARGMQVSTDAGATWPTQLGRLPGSSGSPVAPTGAAFTRTGQYLLVGSVWDGSNFGFQRIDVTAAAPSWTTPAGVAAGTRVVAVECPAAFATWCFVATVDRVYWSTDDGTTFSPLAALAAGTTINDLAVASDSSGATLYVTVSVPAGYGGVWTCTIAPPPATPTQWADVTASPLPMTVNGTTWPQYRFVAVAEADPNTPYVAIFNNQDTFPGPYYSVFNGQRSGATISWQGVYDGFTDHANANVEAGWVEQKQPAGRDWGFGGPPEGFTVDPKNSQHAIYTNEAAVQVTTNGATNWSERYTRLTAAATATDPARWQTTGLDVTTVWHYDVGWSPEVHLMSCTDIGLLRSTDGGASWSLACFSNIVTAGGRTTGALWGNCYELAFKPGTDTVFAAVSDEHDIPHAKQLDIPRGSGSRDARAKHWGAVLRSDDRGRTWMRVAGAQSTDWGATFTYGAGETLGDGPVVSLILRNGVLYASVWQQGVYWSADDGATWHRLGVFPFAAPYCHRLQLAPDGNLYCLTTIQDTAQPGSPNIVNGALWQLTPQDMGGAPPGTSDVTAAWRNRTDGTLYVSPPPRLSMMDFAIDPVDPQTIFLCSETTGPASVGGLFSTDDAGATWRRSGGDPNLLPDTGVVATNYPFWLDAFSVAIFGNRIYATTLRNGIVSSDYPTTRAGRTTWWPTWSEYKATRFMGAQRIDGSLDTVNRRSRLFIGTFGASAWPLERRWSFVTDHNTISRQEAAGTVQEVAYLILDGFSGPEVGITSSAALPPVTITIPGAPNPQVTAALADLQQEDADLAVPQRLTLRCDLTFTGTASFPATATDPPVTATISWQNGPFQCSADVQFIYPPHPYILDGPVTYLSEGVRVFRVLAGATTFGVALPPNATPTDARQYLQTLLANLNSGGDATFDSMPTDWQGGSNLQIQPHENGTNVYNVAIARVNYAGGTALGDVRVFFRLFRWGAAAVDYDPDNAYRYAPPTPAGSPRQPQVPLLGVESVGGGFEVVSIPCFANARVDPTSQALSAQTDPLNQHSFAASETVHYFGCVLDMNDPTAQPLPSESMLTTSLDGTWPVGSPFKSVQDYILGRHQCVIAEVHSWSAGPDPLNPGDTPGSSDCMSQRNLFILGSDNPGGGDSHTVAHPFSIRALRGARFREESDDTNGRLRDDAPDELMLWWGDVPRATRATLYTPEIDVSEILELAARRAGPQRLTRVDGHTIRCEVDGLTYVPLPPILSDSPALIMLELPDSVRYGEVYRMRVRQLGGVERAILGGFEITVPVRRPRAFVRDEENALAVMRYVEQQLPEGDRRRAVMRRYLDQLARKVGALGGDPKRIPPSPYGAPGRGIVGCLTWLLGVLGLASLARARRR